MSTELSGRAAAVSSYLNQADVPVSRAEAAQIVTLCNERPEPAIEQPSLLPPKGMTYVEQIIAALLSSAGGLSSFDIKQIQDDLVSIDHPSEAMHRLVHRAVLEQDKLARLTSDILGMAIFPYTKRYAEVGDQTAEEPDVIFKGAEWFMCDNGYCYFVNPFDELALQKAYDLFKDRAIGFGVIDRLTFAAVNHYTQLRDQSGFGNVKTLVKTALNSPAGQQLLAKIETSTSPFSLIKDHSNHQIVLVEHTSTKGDVRHLVDGTIYTPVLRPSATRLASPNTTDADRHDLEISRRRRWLDADFETVNQLLQTRIPDRFTSPLKDVYHGPLFKAMLNESAAKLVLRLAHDGTLDPTARLAVLCGPHQVTQEFIHHVRQMMVVMDIKSAQVDRPIDRTLAAYDDCGVLFTPDTTILASPMAALDRAERTYPTVIRSQRPDPNAAVTSIFESMARENGHRVKVLARRFSNQFHMIIEVSRSAGGAVHAKVWAPNQDWLFRMQGELINGDEVAFFSHDSSDVIFG